MTQDAPYARKADPDMDLVRRVRQGDDAAFGRVVEIHGPRLYLLALSMLGNRHDAEDVVQDTFTGAFGGFGGFQGRASLKTWLTRILVNKIVKLRRRGRLRNTSQIDDTGEPTSEATAKRTTETGLADVRMDMQSMIGRLSEEHRSVILLREIQGMTYDEIATVLAVPRGTVESRLFRARQKLRELMGDYLT